MEKIVILCKLQRLEACGLLRIARRFYCEIREYERVEGSLRIVFI